MFVELGYRLDRLRFHRILPDKLVVNDLAIIENTGQNKSSSHSSFLVFLLQEVPDCQTYLRNRTDSLWHSLCPQTHKLHAGQLLNFISPQPQFCPCQIRVQRVRLRPSRNQRIQSQDHSGKPKGLADPALKKTTLLFSGRSYSLLPTRVPSVPNDKIPLAG